MKNTKIIIDNRDGIGTYFNGVYTESFLMGAAGRQFKIYNWVVVDTQTHESEFFSTKKEAKENV